MLITPFREVVRGLALNKDEDYNDNDVEFDNIDEGDNVNVDDDDNQRESSGPDNHSISSMSFFPAVQDEYMM